MQQGSGKEAQDEEFLKVLIFAVITFIIIIWLLKTQENRANALLGALSYLHIAPFAEIVRFMPFLMDIPVLGNFFFRPIAIAHDFLAEGGFAYMTGEQRSGILSISGRVAIMLYGPVLLWIAWKGRELRPDQSFKNGHTLESMINVQTEDWVTARVARHVNKAYEVDINPRMIADAVSKKIKAAESNPMPGLALPRKHISLRPDPWNRALRPEEWLVSKGVVFDALSYERFSDPHSIAKSKDFTFHDKWDEIEMESLSEVLAQQLRTKWQGIEKTKPIYRAVFAAMALFYNFDVKGGNQLLNDIALISDSVKLKPGSMNAALSAQTALMGKIDRICSGDFGKRLEKHGDQHAYMETAFPSFLSVSRKDRGVLPSSAFLWLKAEDRLMWYILNNVGNEAILVEAAGAIAHWRAECQYGMKIRRPAVFQASRSFLEDYLDQMEKRKIMRRDRRERRMNPSQRLQDYAQKHAGLYKPQTELDGTDE